MKNKNAFEAAASTKCRQTDTHVYFVSGIFSQWSQTGFRQALVQGGPVLAFNCGEQYMMASKAVLFNDCEHKRRIMAVQQQEDEDFREVPKRQKALGRDVENFDLDVWNAHAKAIVFRGNWAKFTQNEAALQQLLDTGDRIIVEGAWYDPVWGVGLAWDDPKIEDARNWRGTNWLGEVLMLVRYHARECLATSLPFDQFDVWAVQ